VTLWTMRRLVGGCLGAVEALGCVVLALSEEESMQKGLRVAKRCWLPAWNLWINAIVGAKGLPNRRGGSGSCYSY
jgi:hypothetical protein